MSLVGFHRFLIASGILFCLGFATWEAVRFQAGAGPGSLALSLLFGVLGLGLVYYLVNLRRFLGTDE